MIEMLKWVVVIKRVDRDRVIHFESNNHPEDVSRVAKRVARVHGINLSENNYKIMTEAEYQANRH